MAGSERSRATLLLGLGLLLLLLVHLGTAQRMIYKVCVPQEMTTECENMGRSDSEVKCVPVQDSTDCALKLSRGEVDFGKLTAEQMLVASYFLDEEGPRAVTVLGEVRDEDRLHEEFAFTAVGIARRKRVPSGNLGQERDLTLCHPGLGRLSSGWSDRVLTEMDEAMIGAQKNFSRCDQWRSEQENHFTALSKVWGPSCRPGTWSMHAHTDATLKEQNPSLCSRCEDREGCSHGAGDNKPHEAAVKCLKNNGDVAFVDKFYAQDIIKNITREGARSEWALVCPQLNLGTNVSTCRWARQPWGGVAARKALARQLGPKLLEWLRPLVPQGNRGFNESAPVPRGKRGVTDPAQVSRELGVTEPALVVPRELGVTEPAARRQDGWQRALIEVILDDYQIYTAAREELSPNKYMARGRRIPTLDDEPLCSKKPLRWCVQEGVERTKCNWMAAAALAAGVRPPILCDGAKDGLECARQVSQHKADLTVTDIDTAHRASMWETADTAEQDFRVSALMYVETTKDHDRHVVALVRSDSDITNATHIRDRKACFPVADGIAFGAFLGVSMKHEELPARCPYHGAVDEYLGDSCVPGASVAEHPGLCALCQAGGGDSYAGKPACSASEGNLFYGTSGALRCLHSGGGEIAYVELAAARETLEQQLVAGISENDFKVLCGAGVSLPVGEGWMNAAEKCSRAHAPAGAALTRMALDPPVSRTMMDTLTALDGLFGLSETKNPSQSFYIYRPFNGTKGVIFPVGSVGLLPKESKVKAVEGYIKLQVQVPKPCGSTGYNGEPGLRVSLPVLLLTLLLLALRMRPHP